MKLDQVNKEIDQFQSEIHRNKKIDPKGLISGEKGLSLIDSVDTSSSDAESSS